MAKLPPFAYSKRLKSCSNTKGSADRLLEIQKGVRIRPFDPIGDKNRICLQLSTFNFQLSTFNVSLLSCIGARSVGRTMVNTVPFSNWLSTLISPRCFCTML